MTIEEFLAQQGLSAEEVAAIVGNEKQSKAMSAALAKFDEGASALARAEAEKNETAKFWEDKTQELESVRQKIEEKDARIADAAADQAQMAAQYVSLAEQGYHVHPEILEKSKRILGQVPSGSTGKQSSNGNGNYLTREEAMKMARGTAPDLVSLTALSNEYYDLFGSPYVAVEQDFAEAQKAGKSLRDFARSKYNFDGKRQEKAQAKAEADYQKRYTEDLAKEKAKWAETHGSNPETRAPLPSKFDRLQKQEGFKNDSWKSQDGREANRAARLKRFENVSIQ